MAKLINLQLGKNGLTQEFLDNLKKLADGKSVESIRVSVLKSACRDRKEFENINQQILNFLGKNFTSKIIGWTIALRKWRKARA
jgi:RNA-binding protein YhbY